MALTRTLITSGALGVLAAIGVYAVAAPGSTAAHSSTQAVAAAVAPAPIPTPTMTVLADCVNPAVLTDGECVTTVPGPVVVVPAQGLSSDSTSEGSPRSVPAAPGTEADHRTTAGSDSSSPSGDARRPASAPHGESEDHEAEDHPGDEAHHESEQEHESELEHESSSVETEH